LGPLGASDTGSALNRQPALAPLDDQLATCGVPFSGPVPALVDPACTGGVTWSLGQAPAGMSIGSDGATSWSTPIAGIHPVTVVASNAFGSGEATYLVEVRDPAPPIIIR